MFLETMTRRSSGHCRKSEFLREEVLHVLLTDLEHEGGPEPVEQQQRVDAGSTGHLVLSLTQLGGWVKQIPVWTSAKKNFKCKINSKIILPENPLCCQDSRCDFLADIKVIAACFLTEVTRFGTSVQGCWRHYIQRLSLQLQLVFFLTSYWS